MKAAITACEKLNEVSSQKPRFRFKCFRNREDQLKKITDITQSNFDNRGQQDCDCHQFAIVTGASGIGKTRFGWEVSNILKKPDSFSNVITKYVFIDFSNGLQFVQHFDRGSKSDASVRLGVRLASQGLLHKDFAEIVSQDDSVYTKFRTKQVLQCIVSDALESATPNAVVALVLHLDEFQFYVNDFDRKNAAEGRIAMKDMLKTIGECMRTGLTKDNRFRRRFFIVPVLTGTAATDIKFLLTEKYIEVSIPLVPLTYDSAIEIFREAYGQRYSKEELNEISAEDHFQIALADSGYIPRLLCMLFSKTKIAKDTDWGGILNEAYARKRHNLLEHLGGAPSAKVLVHFALSAQIIRRGFKISHDLTIGNLERGGHLFLRPVKNDVSGLRFRVHMPFVQLARINSLLLVEGEGNGAFDRKLLNHPNISTSWSWKDFEELHGHFQAMRMNSLLSAAHLEARQSQKADASAPRHTFPLSELCRGALGHKDTLSIGVTLDPAIDYKCFHEQNKWLHKRTDRPPVVNEVQCKERSDGVSLYEGVFLCADNTALFDGRFCAHTGKKPFLLVWQDKHSALTSLTTVSKSFIVDWHKKATEAMSEHHKTHTVVYLFLTNRRLACSPFDPDPGLLVVTRDQLTQYLSPTLAGRGLVPVDWHPDR